MASALPACPRACVQARRAAPRRRWRRIAAPALWATSAAVFGQPASGAFEPAQSLQLGRSVLKVEVRRPQGGYGLGSGVVLAPDLVVTNCHVTGGEGEVFVLRDGLRWRAMRRASDTEHDLCLLQVAGLRASAVEMGNTRELQPGHKVLALGYTGGLGLQRSEGDIVALHPLDGARVLQVSTFFTSGASGGALFDARMRLVGILTFRLPGGETHYYAAPADWLPSLMEAANGAPNAEANTVNPRLPYWQRPAQGQPLFLQAAVLERAGRWSELERLCATWTESADDDAQAWMLHGVALAGLRRWPQARRSLERAVSLQPAMVQAWFALGAVLLEQGEREGARLALARLRELNSERATELARLIEPN